jgi:hypothetical protein
MSDDLSCYIQDHLAGATFAIELLSGLREQQEELEVADHAEILLQEIEKDCDVLRSLAAQLGTSTASFKDAVTWMAQKASRIKLNLNTSFGIFEAVEMLSLGVLGKMALWSALRSIQNKPEPILRLDFDELLERARTQYAILEKTRLELASHVLGIDALTHLVRQREETESTLAK